jgi:hypothetical protein
VSAANGGVGTDPEPSVVQTLLTFLRIEKELLFRFTWAA